MFSFTSTFFLQWSQALRKTNIQAKWNGQHSHTKTNTFFHVSIMDSHFFFKWQPFSALECMARHTLHAIFFCIGWECCRGRSTRRKYQSDKWSSASGLLNHLKRRPARERKKRYRVQFNGNKLGFVQKHSDWHISTTHAADSIRFKFQLFWFSANEECAKQIIEWVDSYDWKVIKRWKYPIRWRDRVEVTMTDSIFVKRKLTVEIIRHSTSGRRICRIDVCSHICDAPPIHLSLSNKSTKFDTKYIFV